MDVMTSRGAIWARRFVVRLNLASIVSKLLTWGGPREGKFRRALLEAAREGDTVWDVGACGGKYTTRLADQVGWSGTVVAFEPSPSHLARLRQRLGDRPNVAVLPIALGGETGTAHFSESGGISHVVEAAEADCIAVPISTGDEIVAREEAGFPNVIKIDTEGLELEVLKGMAKTLSDARLRVILIEVHFQILSRKPGNAPAEMVKLLKASGFQLRWLEPSHVMAFRN